MKSGQRREKTEGGLGLLERIVDSLPDGVLAVDRAGKVVVWNRAIEEMTGVRKEEVLGRGEYTYAVPFYGERRPILVNILLGNGKEWEIGYEKVERKGHVLAGEGFAPYAYDGRGLHFWTIAAPIYDEAGNLLGAVQCIRDIGERKQMEDELRHLNTHDALTGLYNRAFFEEKLRRLEKGRSFPVSLILCDLDDLKVVNDTLGHTRGDELLRRAARVIASCVRGSDLVARIGGDEFAVVLAQTNQVAAEEVARRITQAVEEDNAGRPEFPLSISVGTATAEDPGRPLVEAYKEADYAMYRDKLAKEAEPEGARKRANQFAFLYDFSRTVSGSLEVSEVAQRALEAVLKVTGATSGSVVMLSQEMPAALAAETAATLELGDEFRIVPAGEVIAAVEREGRAVHFDSRPGAGTAAEKRPAVAVPLIVGGTVTGVLTVTGRPEGVPFSEDEAAFLTTLGTGLGLALRNARLYRQLQAKAAMLERLIDLGQALAGHLHEDKVLEMALVGVSEGLGAQWCALHLLDGETGELVLKVSLGMSAELQERAARVRPEGSLLGEALRRGEPVAVEDTAAAGPGMQLPYYAPEVRAMAVAPVRAGGKMLGTLKVYSPVPRRWPEEEIEYLATVAGQVGLALENARLYASLRQYYLSALQALAAALEAKDTYTRGHSVRVARLAQACARVLGLSDEEQEQIHLAALLHDIGKIGVPESILSKPGLLELAEWDEVKSHPVVGVRIVEPAGFHPQVVAAIRHHHENYGGGGYPDGLAGKEIPLLARIISVADAYDAMTSDRPYRRPRTAEEAMEELRRGAGRQFDPLVAEAFLRIPAPELENTGGGVGALVTLLTEVLCLLAVQPEVLLDSEIERGA
ncbi:MAG: HD domain-containing phosphohydrolase [Bacillota bacterium]